MKKIFLKFTRSFSTMSESEQLPPTKTNPPNLPYPNLLQRCSTIKQLRLIHTHLIVIGLVRYTYIASKLLSVYATSHYGDINHAESVFRGINPPTIFDWNTMIKAYSKTSKPEMGLLVYIRMTSDGVSPNMRTFPVLIKACNGVSSLSQIHGQIVKFAFDIDVYVISSLINMYAKYGAVGFARRVFEEAPVRNVVCWTSLITVYSCHGLVDEARKLFDQMPVRTDVSWSAMISGYVRNDCFNEAIQLFHELKDCRNLKPNQSSLVSVLNACAGLGAFVEGIQVHSYIDEHEFQYELELGTALVDFYLKCGCVEIAQQVFSMMHYKDVMSWSAMIMGLAVNGYSDLALAFFMDMEKSGTKPNAITFIGVLTACSHGGLVDEGWRFFDSLSRDYGISPRIEHYGCMVDLLGRAGKVKEAEQLINSMPIKPDEIIWGALLNGCMMHGHMELGERVGKHLIEAEPQQSGKYVLLANMYATMGRWEGVSELRKLMKDKGVTTVLGSSFIELNGGICRFIANDKTHPRSKEIYEMLSQLNKELTTSRSGKAISPTL